MTTERLAEIDLVELKALVEKATQGPLCFEIVADGDDERLRPSSEWTGLYIGPESDDPPGSISHTIFEGGFTHGAEDGDPEADAALWALAPTLARQVLALSEEVERLKAPAEPPKLTDLNWPDGRPKIAPVQGYAPGIPWSVHLKAYEAYCKRWGKQDALIDLAGRGCRGGFSVGELDDFIPGWRDEVEELALLRKRATAAEAEARTLREVLEWYGENARLCRLIHSEGDTGRNALAADGGSRARAALATPKDGEKK